MKIININIYNSSDVVFQEETGYTSSGSDSTNSSNLSDAANMEITKEKLPKLRDEDKELLNIDTHEPSQVKYFFFTHFLIFLFFSLQKKKENQV